MKKIYSWMVGFAVLFGALSGTVGLREAGADVDVQVNIGAPAVVVDEPDEIIFMPGYGVYFVPDGEYDIFFYNGFWWSRRGNSWYRSRTYRGGWTVIKYQNVPRSVFRVPNDYRGRFGRGNRIKYKVWKATRGRPVGGHSVGKKTGSENRGNYNVESLGAKGGGGSRGVGKKR